MCRDQPTYLKYIIIDGMRTRCECLLDTTRVIGLDVIHRYTHTIDYRKRYPRVWSKRDDLTDDP